MDLSDDEGRFVCLMREFRAVFQVMVNERMINSEWVKVNWRKKIKWRAELALWVYKTKSVEND